MSNKEAEAPKLRMVQSQKYFEEELASEISSRHPITNRRLRGSRMERSELVGEAVELLNYDPAAEGKVPRPIHQICDGFAPKNFNFSRH
jgi:hypothetical protein